MFFPWLTGVTNQSNHLLTGMILQVGRMFHFKAWYLQGTAHILCSGGVCFICLQCFWTPATYPTSAGWQSSRDVDLKMSQRFNKWFVTGLWRDMRPLGLLMELKGRLWCVFLMFDEKSIPMRWKSHPWDSPLWNQGSAARNALRVRFGW